jgi:hypothetical protein
MHSKGKEFLFITGTSRSGTTALADLLRADPRILMGRERFASLRKNQPADYNPSLFEKERMCHNLYKGDSHHQKLDEYYEKAFSIFDAFQYVGDKDPNLFESYNLLKDKFPDCKIIYICRNIIEVAFSFQMRANRTKCETLRLGKEIKNAWPIKRGWQQAIKEWNTSLAMTTHYLDQLNIAIVAYEEFFRNEKSLIELYHYLGLDFVKPVVAKWKSLQFQSKSWRKIERTDSTRYN